MLRHLKYPERQDRQACFWGRSASWVSKIFHATLTILYSIAQRAFRRWPPFHLRSMKEYCERMSFLTRGLIYAHALLDGSGLLVCRPTDEKAQQSHYSGCERAHVIRLLALVGLSGLFIRVFGVFPGSASDEAIFNAEELDTQLETLHDWAVDELDFNRRPTVASDAGFSASKDLKTPFAFDPDAPEFSVESVYNLIHSRMRVPNEWGFGRNVNTFQSLGFRSILKTGWTRPQMQYIVSMMFTNLVVVCEGSQTEMYFGVKGPDLNEYLDYLTSN